MKNIYLYHMLISKYPQAGNTLIIISIIKQYCPGVRMKLFIWLTNKLISIMSPLFMHIANNRINRVLMLLLTEHFLLRENTENYEHSLKQDCSTQWPDGFTALSEKLFINFLLFPEERRANSMMIEIKILRMERAFFKHGKIVISIFLKDVQYLNKIISISNEAYTIFNWIIIFL